LLEQINAMASSVRMVVTPILERRFIDDMYKLDSLDIQTLREFIRADMHRIEYAGAIEDGMHSLEELERIIF
jgi:hypothetical protein